jgi:hypothetical protein
MIEARRTLRFSPETDAQLEALAKVMHAGNMTATISELIRAEVDRRKRGDAPSQPKKPTHIPLLEEIGVFLTLSYTTHPLADPILKASYGAVSIPEVTKLVHEFNDELANELEIRVAMFNDGIKEMRKERDKNE